MQDNFISITKGKFHGIKGGAYNKINIGTGIQWGGINIADNFAGIQFGLVNYAVVLNGFQIGVINIIKQGGMFPFMPIVNWSYTVK